ncbi:hypothetical protein CY34DRAFT_811399, partial [Suillus luteus UH-Slu-Lm8-n1]
MHKDIVCNSVAGWKTNQDTGYTYETHPQPSSFLLPPSLTNPLPLTNSDLLPTSL